MKLKKIKTTLFIDPLQSNTIDPNFLLQKTDEPTIVFYFYYLEFNLYQISKFIIILMFY